MNITLTQSVRIVGVEQASGTKLTVSDDLGADLIKRKAATNDNPTFEPEPVMATKNLTGGIDISASGSKIYFADTDKRKLQKWFSGGIAGKSVVMSGDSTTWSFATTFSNGAECVYRDGRRGRVQIKYPEFRDVAVYNRGENGGGILGFISDAFTNDHKDDPTVGFYHEPTYSNLSSIIALKADLYVLCWGINECRVGTSFTWQNLADALTTAVTSIRAEVPKACIILRMPNAHGTANSGGYMSAGATAQNMMDRYQKAYRSLRSTWPDVLVWDSQNGLYPSVAPASSAFCPLLSTDDLHPSVSGYDQILDAIFGLATPAPTQLVTDLYAEGTKSNPFAQNRTDGLIRWDSAVDPAVLNGPDWYKVYSVQFGNAAARGSYFRLQFMDFAGNTGSAGTPSRNHAWTSGVAAPGLCKGDVVSFENRAGQAYTFVVNADPQLQSGTDSIQFSPHPAGTWSAAETEDLIAGHPIPDAAVFKGYVYRHKYAHCEGMRRLQALLASPTIYDAAAETVNPYAVKRRFFIYATPSLGAITVQTIGGEPGGDLSLRTWATTDVLFIPGVSSGAKVGAEYNAAIAMPLTGATFTADATNKRMVIAGVTSGGVLVDFSKYVIPQGYVLSAT